MDNSVIQSKLISLKRCIERVESKIPASISGLSNSYDLQDIITLNLQRAIQISVDIAAHIVSEIDSTVPATMAQSFEILYEQKVISSQVAERMKKSIGFRNIAVHEYTSLDWEVVYNVVTTRLHDFRDYASEIVIWLRDQIR
jgi:uncharacterized protein YutE (UPF0331/DUF86 family)